MAAHGGDTGAQAGAGPNPIQGYAANLIQWKVRRMTARMGLGDADQRDLAQQLRLEVLRRAKRYRPDRGDWHHFLRVIVDRCSRTLAHGYRRHRRTILMEGVEMAATFTPDDHQRRVHRSPLDPANVIELRLDVSEILAALSAQDQWLCQALRSLTISEVAVREGVPRSTVHDSVRRLRRAFRKLDPRELTR